MFENSGERKNAALVFARLRSTHCASVSPGFRNAELLHCVISSVQWSQPGASGSRRRKSLYCQNTNVRGSSIGFGAGGMSLTVKLSVFTVCPEFLKANV